MKIGNLTWNATNNNDIAAFALPPRYARFDGRGISVIISFEMSGFIDISIERTDEDECRRLYRGVPFRYYVKYQNNKPSHTMLWLNTSIWSVDTIDEYQGALDNFSETLKDIDRVIQALPAIRKLTNKTDSPKPRYVLCETIERNIYTPEFFDTMEAAYAEMVDRFQEATNLSDEEMKKVLAGEDVDEFEMACGDTTAYCKNSNHDNCDWSIFEIR